ncbi:MAG: SigE family RNA polymerase sigma factor [Nocardioides sp.]
MQKEPGFDDWLFDAEGALQRTAHLLTGSVSAGQDLVQNTLARLYRRWARVRLVDDVDAHARRTLVDELRTAWRRPGRRGDVLLEVGPDRPAPGSPSYDAGREAVWDLVCSLSPQQRIVVVLRFHEQLSEAETADLTGASVDTVASQSSLALASLEVSEEQLTRTLAEVTETTYYPTTWTSTVAARSRALAGARRRTAALVAAVAALVVVGGSTLVLRNHDRATALPRRPEAAASLRSISQGTAPQVAFLEGDAFVTPQGDRVTAPALGSATTAAATGHGVLVAGRTTSQRPFATISLVSGGSTRRLGCGTPVFALGSGSPAYWLSDGCRFLGPGRLVHGATTTPTAKGVIYFPVGSTRRGVVAVGTVVLPQGAGSDGPVLIGPDGSFRRIPHLEVVTATSPSGALVAGTDPQGHGVVTELSTGAVRWRTRVTLGHFSASGRYVVTMQNVGVQTVEGVGDVVGIREAATGRRVTSTVLPDLTIVGRPVWEGDHAVLVVAEDRQGQQAIVRVGLDGRLSRATPVAPAGRGSFRLAATP